MTNIRTLCMPLLRGRNPCVLPAVLLAAQARGWQLFYMEQADLYLKDGDAFARIRPLTVRDQTSDWFQLGTGYDQPLADLDVILMRKDPPFDMEYLYTTFLLERAELEGLTVINRPASLRDSNEKLFTAWFSEFTPTTLVTRSSHKIREFHALHRDVILKPLDGMGGACS